MLSRFHLIPERYGRTDKKTDRQTEIQTDIFAISISRVSVLTRDKKNGVSDTFTMSYVIPRYMCNLVTASNHWSYLPHR